MPPRERAPRFAPQGGMSSRDTKDQFIAFRLGDLFERLPVALLSPGEHDASRIIRFEITEVARQIAEGRPNIELTEIYRQVPDVFVGEIKSGDGFRVRFPWQRLIEMLRAADANTPADGLTRNGALHLARLLRGHTGSLANRTLGRIAAGAAALTRAPQWFTRNIDSSDGANDGERILRELATALEQFTPGEASETSAGASDMGSSEALAIASEENTRLRADLDERDREIQSLRKMLTELESAAIDQIAALNQQCEEYEAARARPPARHDDLPLNPQQTAMIESLTQQVAELFIQLDQAREESLQATADHAKYRNQQQADGTSAADARKYLESVAYELERANAVLKEMEGKLMDAETALAKRHADFQRLQDEHAVLRQQLDELRIERDALRGQLYSGARPAPPSMG